MDFRFVGKRSEDETFKLASRGFFFVQCIKAFSPPPFGLVVKGTTTNFFFPEWTTPYPLRPRLPFIVDCPQKKIFFFGFPNIFKSFQFSIIDTQAKLKSN